MASRETLCEPLLVSSTRSEKVSENTENLSESRVAWPPTLRATQGVHVLAH